MYSYSEEDFEVNWNGVCTEYDDEKEAVNYIKETWINLKEIFVECYTDKYLHLVTTSTSRIEGSQAVLKKYLRGRNIDIVLQKSKTDVTNPICPN